MKKVLTLGSVLVGMHSPISMTYLLAGLFETQGCQGQVCTQPALTGGSAHLRVHRCSIHNA